MYFIYEFLITVLFIIFLPIILILMLLKPKFRAGFFQKIGFYKNLKKENQKHIVIHAVSVGEVLAVEKFVKKLREEFENEKIILTTVTKTGNGVAHKKLENTVDEIIYFPFDFFFAVKSFINNIKPDIVVIAETEIWPYFSRELKNKNIPLLIANGRISPHSYNGYKKFKWFFEKVLSNYSQILMQSDGDRERIVNVGAPSDITKVMGNFKFDISNDLTESDILNLKNEFKLENNPMILVGSTHKGEDEIALSVYKKLVEVIPKLKLLIAPRHPERLNDVENLIKETGFNYGKRSNKDTFENNNIIMLDTMGELAKLYSISKVAFIGGSFSGTGGHNPLEASIFNIPVVSGPSTFNFKDIYKYLTDDNAAFVINDENELFESMLKLLKDEEFYKQTSDACHKVFETNSGAIDFAINIIKETL
ncbi:MAG: 3-deoxy-D-manno-octulosonic acid transferase [Candidatus Gastranaerophilales bacterium]|nr:3-deoxy-D-manno-octulosonic acid transferase [Candidatus Gastranaerophilales bacterium]